MPEKKLKVLIVDDEPILLDMYKVKLAVDRYDTVTAENGKQGLAMVTEHKPDIVLLDLLMPELDGFGFLEEIRKGENKDIPVIILTNLNREEDVERAKSLGADDFMIKAQFTPSEVSKKIEEVLGREKVKK